MRYRNFVSHGVCEGRFGGFSRMVGNLSGPVAEARPEAVDGHRLPLHAAQDHFRTHVRERTPFLRGENEVPCAARHCVLLTQQRQRAPPRRHNMVDAGFHSRRGNRPRSLKVELGPDRIQGLA